MLLDLRKIISSPGVVSFSYEPDISELDFPSVRRFLSPLHAEGKVTNSAGLLTLNALLSAKMLCVCDRCGDEYENEKRIEVEVILSENPENDENPDIYPIINDKADLDEIFITAFVLDMETKFLCSEDCPGLCPKCGKPLKNGGCSCKKDTDPRLAVLEQLLNK